VPPSPGLPKNIQTLKKEQIGILNLDESTPEAKHYTESKFKTR